jgi:hypothetical protein
MKNPPCTLLILSLATVIMSETQSYNVFARLAAGDGLMPRSLVQGTDGNFYGVGQFTDSCSSIAGMDRRS